MEAEFHRRVAPEDGNQHGELLRGGFDIGDDGSIVANGPSMT